MGKKKNAEMEMENMTFPDITHPKKRAFLAAYSRMGVITHAAEAAGIDRKTYYHWIETDPEFAEAAEQAYQASADRLEQEAIRRAVEGWEEPVYQKGKKVGTVRKYSDTLLIFLMKGAKPEKYSERLKAELEHSGGISLEISIPDTLDEDDDE